MRGHWAYRSAAGLMIVFFLILTVGMGEAAHVCPVHDPMLAEAMATGSIHHGGGHGATDAHAAVDAHAATGAHAQHAQMQHAQTDLGQQHGDHQQGHGRAHCCCTGFACVTAAVTLPSARVELPTVAITTASAPELPEYARSAAATAYFIPFANGPPTLSERSA